MLSSPKAMESRFSGNKRGEGPAVERKLLIPVPPEKMNVVPSVCKWSAIWEFKVEAAVLSFEYKVPLSSAEGTAGW